jgi:hypothetical protein
MSPEIALSQWIRHFGGLFRSPINLDATCAGTLPPDRKNGPFSSDSEVAAIKNGWSAKSALMRQILQSRSSDGLATYLNIRQRGDSQPGAQ